MQEFQMKAPLYIEAMAVSSSRFGENPIFDKGERLELLTKQGTQFSFP